MHSLILEPTAPGAPTITFEGPTLPEEELTERIRVTTATHRYPGATSATIQVLTVENRPIILKGLLSDRETNTPGLADAYRAAITELARSAVPIALIYRNLILHGIVTRAEFSERNPFETRYEIEIEIARDLASPAAGEAQESLNDRLQQSLSILLEAAELDYEELPEDIRTPPNPDIETELDTATPERIAILFSLDPWLEARLDAEALFRAARVILELIGNETALNVSDAVQAAARTVAVAANKVRTGLSDWDGSPLGLAQTLTDARNVSAATSSVQNIALIF